MSGASVSEQEFACEFYGYEVYWVNKQVPREEMLEEFDKFKWSGLTLNQYLIKIGKKKRYNNKSHPRKRHKKHVKK